MTPILACKWFPRHLPTVVHTRRVRDAFRRRYWVVCWTCVLRLGPFRLVSEAHQVRVAVER